MYATGTTTISTSAPTAVALGGTSYAVGVTCASSSITILTAGKYVVTGGIGTINGAGNALLTGMMDVEVYKNGSRAIINRVYCSSNYPAATCSDILDLAVNDVLTLFVYFSNPTVYSGPAGGLGVPNFLACALVSD